MRTPRPPVVIGQESDFETDVHEVMQAHVAFRKRLPQLVQDAVPLGDLLMSLRRGMYAEIVPTSGRKWFMSQRGCNVRLMLEWMVEVAGYRVFHFSRTHYIALPAPAPLPPQAGGAV